MNANEIIEGNKLIAEFMGATKYKGTINGGTDKEAKYCFYSFTNGGIKPYSDFEDEFTWGRCCPLDTELKFNSSWNWLMPVVEKIANLPRTKIKMESICGCFKVVINESKWPRESFIEATYYAVIAFIKQYNK